MNQHEQHIHMVHRPAEYNLFGGLRILVPSDVYHPHVESSTFLLLETLPDVHGLDVLEIGGGSGALALSIKQRGARKVVATDISEKACAAMECNALVNGLDLDVRCGNLFEPVHDHERYALVIFNLPLLDKPVAAPSEVALCDPNGDLLNRFLAGVRGVCAPGGSALFTHASISAPLPLVTQGMLRIEKESFQYDGAIFRVLSWRNPG